jgi:hypothetical protein
MKKIFLTLTAALSISIVSFGQPSAQSDMTAVARSLAALIPELDGKTVAPKETGEHYLRGNFNDDELGTITLQLHRYRRPAATSDWVLVVYDVENLPIETWLKCFTLDRATGTLAAAELPFEILPPSRFDRDEFGEDHGYWRTSYTISDNGDVLITGSPGMAWFCTMIARWDGKGFFTVFRRAGYDVNIEVATDNAETERYVQNVVRPNFQRINAIDKWAWIEEKYSSDVALEGATLNYYYSADGLEKIVAFLSGESYKSVVEYYFLDGQLSFIYDVTTKYSVPSYVERTADTPPDTKTERRWYLKGSTCFRGIGDNGQKLTPAQIEKEFYDRAGGYGAFPLYMSIIGL